MLQCCEGMVHISVDRWLTGKPPNEFFFIEWVAGAKKIQCNWAQISTNRGLDFLVAWWRFIDADSVVHRENRRTEIWPTANSFSVISCVKQSNLSHLKRREWLAVMVRNGLDLDIILISFSFKMVACSSTLTVCSKRPVLIPVKTYLKQKDMINCNLGSNEYFTGMISF